MVPPLRDGTEGSIPLHFRRRSPFLDDIARTDEDGYFFIVDRKTMR